MTQGRGSSQVSTFLEPLFNRAVTLALAAIVIFLVIYVIAVEQRLRQTASAGDASEVRMAALEDADRKARPPSRSSRASWRRWRRMSAPWRRRKTRPRRMP